MKKVLDWIIGVTFTFSFLGIMMSAINMYDNNKQEEEIKCIEKSIAPIMDERAIAEAYDIYAQPVEGAYMANSGTTFDLAEYSAICDYIWETVQKPGFDEVDLRENISALIYECCKDKNIFCKNDL